jgi:hypothetical protein
MRMQHVDSSNIHSIGHDPSSSTMHVKFKNGALYEYHNVAPHEYDQIKNHASPGTSLRHVTIGKQFKKIG